MMFVALPMFIINVPLEFLRHPDFSSFNRSKGFGNMHRKHEYVLTDYGYWKLREFNELKHQT